VTSACARQACGAALPLSAGNCPLQVGLEGTGLHFVRCIKPNMRLLPNTFEQAMVLQQLR
jgi:hypothetical protein